MSDPFARSSETTIGSLGERALLARIRQWLGSVAPASPHGMGDDTAVLPTPAGNLLTTDSLVFGRHFDEQLPPGAAGAKLLKRNLSDIAAMGGEPGSAVLAGFLPPNVHLEWLEAFVRGLAACAAEWDVDIVGGDLAQSDGFLGFNLTLSGQAKRPLLRSGGRIGDEIWVTGELGASIASHHASFTPRLPEGVWLAGNPELRAAIDVTDGLAKDLPALLPNGAAAELDLERIPLRGDGTGIEAAFVDGEDYELLLIIAAGWAGSAAHHEWEQRFSTRLTRIGRIVTKGDRNALLRDARTGVDLEFAGGYEHFRGT